MESSEKPEENGEAPSSDRDVAQAIAQEDEVQASGRRTRRRGETSTVFYGNQSTMTLKQGVQNLLCHYLPEVKEVVAE